MDLTTLDMEIAMIKEFNPRQNIVVPNVSWSMFNRMECDLVVLSKDNYATEIEIKITKSDLKADAKKRHEHKHPLLARNFFAVPYHLEDVALETIPEHCGLYVITPVTYRHGSMHTRHAVTLVRRAKRNKDAIQWTADKRCKLARLGTLRILGLKQTINTQIKNDNNNRKVT